MTPLRRGGRADGAAGTRLVWSVADGRRGARWREVASDGEGVIRSILLEVAPTGRPERLEVTTRAGLLTLHPEPDASALHGNVVTPDGIRHLAFAWSADHGLLVAGSPVAAAVLVGRLAHVRVGDTVETDVVRMADDLEPTAERWAVARPRARAWSLRPTGDRSVDAIELELDAMGLPSGVAARSWPLER